MANFGYMAIFFEAEEILGILEEMGLTGVRLAKTPQNFHTTVEFYGSNKPDPETLAELEKLRKEPVEVNVLIVAYGNNGETEGFRVIVPHGLRHQEVQNNGVTPLHITISIAEGHEAKETGKNSFDQPIKRPFKVKGLLGWSLSPLFKEAEYRP